MSKWLGNFFVVMRMPLLALAGVGIAVVCITGFWPVISSYVLPNTVWGLYSKAFFENVLAEAHGMVLDLLVIGTVIYWFQLRRDKTDLKDQTFQNIEDLRHYRGEDAGYRVYGELRRLAGLGVSEVTIATARITNVSIKNLKLRNSNAQGVVFTKSRLSDCDFSGCDFDGGVFIDVRAKRTLFHRARFCRSKLAGAQFKGCDFTGADLRGADFSNADLSSAIFREANCAGARFGGANLRSANFIGATNVPEDMQDVAADVRSIKLLKTGGNRTPLPR